MKDYNVYNLSKTAQNVQIQLGFEIFSKTAKYLGPDQRDTLKAYAGNRLACTNCHLDGGTRPYASPLIGVVKRFPQYRAREDKMGTIEERINGCLERSLNGKAMPENAEEMRALVAYLNWLGTFVPSDGSINGQGFLSFQIPQRAVDNNHGKKVFQEHCAVCHGYDGQGQLATSGPGYQYPPLWGDDSFNHGAGMTRVLTAAAFIKGNMPYGTRYDQPVLTDEEAYDVAGYINQKKRPQKQNGEADFPDLKKKPVSTPYGPYADHFSQKQHQIGPFQPIIDYYKKEYGIQKSK